MPTVDSSERDNKETLFVKEEVTNDAEVFGEVKVDFFVSHSEQGPEMGKWKWGLAPFTP